MNSLELRAFYRDDEELRFSPPAGTARIVARRACGQAVEATVERDARLGPLDAGTYAVEAIAGDGSVLAEELTTVGAHPGARPVAGFVTSFEDAAVAPTLAWLGALRCTAVQLYDWMDEYSRPLGPEGGWSDPLGRAVSSAALRALIGAIREQGAAAQAYAPVYAVDPPFARAHPRLLLYRGDGAPQRLGDLLELAHPGSDAWQRHWLAAYGEAADRLGFDGFHLDSYGYPRAALDAGGAAVELRPAYAAFLGAVRAARPAELVSFNQVNGVPRALELPAGPGFRYVEVWPPNTGWRHLEGLVGRSRAAPGPVVLACYPPVWDGARADALRTVLLTDAIATTLGASLLAFGDRRGVLSGAYYPEHERLDAREAAAVLRWRRFALRCRDLFAGGEDTSWYEAGDENGAVSVEARPAAPSGPEPAGRSVCVRVARGERAVAVSALDLTGSAHGLWSQPTARGRCRSARVRVLLGRPERWSAAAAVLGAADERFAPLPVRLVEHREGRAVEAELPLRGGWSVLRLVRREEL